MEERFNQAPCGFVTMTSDGLMKSANETFLNMLNYSAQDVIEKHIESILSAANKFFFHTYFYPFIRLYGHVDEMYLSLKSGSGQDIHVLLNGRRYEQDGVELIDCVFVHMRKRIEYEQELRNIKTKLEEAYKAKDEVIAELQALHRENEQKRQELIALNGQLERLATTDTLTGLKNRRFFQERLAASIALFAEKASPCSLCIVDADHFKRINDTLGHDAGDRVLKQLAGIMQAGSRAIDTVARFGGEEFVILLPGLEEQQVKAFAEKLRSAIERAPWSECAVTVSIGTATLTESDTDNTIITKADRALYTSKAGGRNRVTHAAELED